MDRGVRTASESLTELMYRALLRELVREDFDLAELEITLEGDKRLDSFVKSLRMNRNRSGAYDVNSGLR